MVGNETDEIIEKRFESLLINHQKDAEETMRRGSNFIFDSVDLLHYHLQKMSLKKGGSYIDSPEWLKKWKSNNKSKK